MPQPAAQPSSTSLPPQRPAHAPEGTLLVLPGSHYCERVLWALEQSTWRVHVLPLAPGAHVLALRRAAPGLPSTQLPLLLHAAGPTQGSDAILDLLGCGAAEPGQDAAAAGQAALVTFIGPRVRQAYYAAAFAQPPLARAWVQSLYAPATPWLQRVTAWAPRRVLQALLRREGVSPADLPRLLNEVCTAATGLGDAAELELRHISQDADAPLSRLAITCGALLAPVMWPAPAPWQVSPWPAPLLPQLMSMQALPAWQLAHLAWARRRQTAQGRCPDRDGCASAARRIPQTHAHGPAIGGQGSA
jgi:Glutathione S-transferase, N-terminal domain